MRIEIEGHTTRVTGVGEVIDNGCTISAVFLFLLVWAWWWRVVRKRKERWPKLEEVRKAIAGE